MITAGQGVDPAEDAPRTCRACGAHPVATEGLCTPCYAIGDGYGATVGGTDSPAVPDPPSCPAEDPPATRQPHGDRAVKTPGQNRQTVMDLEQELGSHENCASLTESDGAYTLEFLLPVDGLDGIRAHYDRRSGKAVALRRILTKLEGMP